MSCTSRTKASCSSNPWSTARTWYISSSRTMSEACSSSEITFSASVIFSLRAHINGTNVSGHVSRFSQIPTSAQGSALNAFTRVCFPLLQLPLPLTCLNCARERNIVISRCGLQHPQSDTKMVPFTFFLIYKRLL